MSTPVSSPAYPRELSFELDIGFAEHLRVVRAAQRHGMARGRHVRQVQRVSAVATAGVTAWSLYAADGVLGASDWLMLAVIAAACLSPLGTMLYVWMARRVQRRPVRITLSEKRIAASDGRSSAQFDWAALRGVCDDREFLLLDMGEVGTFPLPMRMLRAPGLLEQVRAMVSRGRAPEGVGEPAWEPASRIPGSPGVSAEFAPRLGESFAVFLRIWFRSRWGRVLTAFLIGAPLALLVTDRWMMGPGASRPNLGLLIPGVAAALLLVPLLALFWIALDLRRTGPSPVRITLDEAGFTHQVLGSSVTFPWSEVRKVQRTAGTLLFWTGRNVAQYLPLRALESADAESEALRLVRLHAGDRAAL